LRVLLVDGYDQSDDARRVSERVTKTLQDANHVVTRVDLAAQGFAEPMSEAERVRYHDEGSNMLVEEVVSAVTQLREADALLFCYPTVTFTAPAPVKNWFDRVLLPGVAFRLDEKDTLRPMLQHISRLGVVTTTPHSASGTRRARDGGRRMIMWTLRMQCGLRCRRTYLRLPASAIDEAKIERAFASW
jgi:NAD(P)H dehydrogenase (quinone)